MSEDLIKTGKVYESNGSGKFVVLGSAGVYKDTETSKPTEHFDVKFLDTGYTTRVTKRAVQSRSIKDYKKHMVSGVGCLGDKVKVSSHPVISKAYDCWQGMLNRCYNTNDPSYKNYGAQDITVDPRWFEFTTFLSDIRWMPGYDEWCFNNNYAIDKDYLQQDKNKRDRIYSKDTCCFITSADNNTMKNIDRVNNNEKAYYGVSVDKSSYAYTTYRCRVINNGESVSYGRFMVPEAAAVVYNYHAKPLGKPMNQGIHMTVADALSYKVSKKELKTMCTIVDKEGE